MAEQQRQKSGTGSTGNRPAESRLQVVRTAGPRRVEELSRTAILLVQALIGAVAAGIPPIAYLVWSRTQGKGLPVDGRSLSIVAFLGMAMGATAAWIASYLGDDLPLHHLYDLVTYILWTCAAATIAFFLGGLILGVGTDNSILLLPTLEAIFIFGALFLAHRLRDY